MYPMVPMVYSSGCRHFIDSDTHSSRGCRHFIDSIAFKIRRVGFPCAFRFTALFRRTEPMYLEVAETSNQPAQDTIVEEQHISLTSEEMLEELDDTATTSSQSSQQSIPEEEISIWWDEMEEQQKKQQVLNDSLGTLSGGRISPIFSTLNTSWDDISSTQQRYYQRKAKETFLTALTVLSPGQEQELWNAIRRETSLETTASDHTRRKSFDPNSEMIDVLIKAYDQAGSWQTKRQILSLFANDFSKTELMKMLPTLSKWRIDQARQHATEVGKGQPIPEASIFRQRISNVQIDHFIDYISRPEMLQDVAFGTKVIKLDSGESIIIPAVVRTMIPTRIIEQYISFCKQQNFVPAGPRSLYRIIKVCAASAQKSLQGLDNTTAEGTDAIDNMAEIITTLGNHGSEFEWVKFAQKKIKEAKRYLKTEFKGHVNREESCDEHCTVHPLSDPDDPLLQVTCQHLHDVECINCMSLDNVIMEIDHKITAASMSEEDRSRLSHEHRISKESVLAWKAHILRTVNQEDGKQDVLTDLDDESCMIVMDWAMKFLPLNSFAIASIIEHLLKTIKKESPQMTRVYFRSDNAGCYHSGQLLLSLPFIGQRTGITPVRYDFSDPQSGKDICDRKMASMKAHLRRWVNEKHDVISAEDIKTALESHGGVKGSRVAVVRIDSSIETAVGANKIPGISLLNNFSFEENGIHAWRAYNVGVGKSLSYTELNVEPMCATNLQVIKSFGSCVKGLGSISDAPAPRAEIFSCSESTCVLTFKTQQEAEAHMDTGKHVQASQCESLYDNVKKKWAEKITEFNVVLGAAPHVAVEEGPSASGESRIAGWALKVIKRSPRMGQKAKTFLIEKFNIGVTGGQKADPGQVSREMKCVRDSTGNLQFKPEEWRTPNQISSFFSRLSAMQRKEPSETEKDHE
ncbi:hypothetical protein QZH41_010250, partial [Actinostola sp. cb2023]